MRLVHVIWDDAHCSTDEITIKKAQKMQPIRTHTIGWLVGENDSGVTLCTDKYEKDKKTGRINNFIGWNMIVDYYHLYGDGLE